MISPDPIRMSTETRNIIANAVLETLETRQLMTAVVATHGHLLDVRGNSDTPNNIAVETDGTNLWVTSDAGKSTPIAINKIRRIYISGGDAADNISVAATLRIPVLVRGGAGNDTITTGAGRDTIYGGNGDDQLTGGGGRDYIVGGNGNDSIIGGAGNDTLIGNTGNDHMTGGRGDDSINAGAGDDTCDGGAGDDRIALGTGNDLANGGAGHDHSSGSQQAVSTSATFALVTSTDGSSTPPGGGSSDSSGSNSGSSSSSGSDSGSGSGSGSGSNSDSGSGSTSGSGSSSSGSSDSGSSGSGSPSDSSDPIPEPSPLPYSKIIEVGPDQAIKSLADVPWPKKGGASIKVILDYSSTAYSTGNITVNGVVTITSADPNHEATLKLPSSFGSTPTGPDVGVPVGAPAFMVNGSLSISNLNTTGGMNGILLGSSQTANIICEDITMTDGGGFWRGSGGENIFFKDNDNLGKPRAYDYANFTNIVDNVVIDNSGTNVPVPQGGSIVNGQPQGETAIRVMDVNNLTMYKVTTAPWFYKPGVIWKQDVQLRPTSGDITIIDCSFYMPDIGDMTWRNPAQPIQKVDFIDSTLVKAPHITSGVKLIEYTNTTIAGKITNTAMKAA